MVNITVIGCGFVGEAVGYGMTSKGYNVLMHDINPARLDYLSGEGYAVEADLETAFNYGEYIFIQVPTPSDKDSVNLAYLEKLISDIKQLPVPDKKKYLIIRSTVVPGTTRVIANQLRDYAFVCFNPEFLEERNARWDFMHPDRIILGGPKEVTMIVEQLFSRFKAPVLLTSYEVAEMCKYAANNWLATNISYWNDIVDICIKMNISSDEVLKVSHYSKYFGEHPWAIGKPFGGACLPKDLRALRMYAKKNNISVPVLDAVEKKNISKGGRDYDAE